MGEALVSAGIEHELFENRSFNVWGKRSHSFSFNLVFNFPIEISYR